MQLSELTKASGKYDLTIFMVVNENLCKEVTEVLAKEQKLSFWR
jgi:hypothetical protein